MDGGVMEKIRLGRTDMMVSRVGFGGVPVQKVSEDEAAAIVRRCLDLVSPFSTLPLNTQTVRSVLAKLSKDSGRGLF